MPPLVFLAHLFLALFSNVMHMNAGVQEALVRRRRVSGQDLDTASGLG